MQRIPECVRQRIVEMHAGDDLHLPPVPEPEAAAVDRLHAADVRRTVAGQRNPIVPRQCARHACRPQHLIVEFRVDELVDVAKTLQRLPGIRECRRDELQEGLGKIGRDVTIRERRAEPRRMWPRGQEAVRRDAQRFLLDAFESAMHGTLPRGRKCGQPLFEPLHRRPPGFCKRPCACSFTISATSVRGISRPAEMLVTFCALCR